MALIPLPTAVARECGVDDYSQQVRLLAAVMCDRDLGAEVDRGDTEPSTQAESTQTDGMPPAFVTALWRLAGLMRAVGDEIVKRPRPRRIFRYLGMLPAVGAVADYFGEYGALVRAAKAGRTWIAHQSVLVPAGCRDRRRTSLR